MPSFADVLDHRLDEGRVVEERPELFDLRGRGCRAFALRARCLPVLSAAEYELYADVKKPRRGGRHRWPSSPSVSGNSGCQLRLPQ